MSYARLSLNQVLNFTGGKWLGPAPSGLVFKGVSVDSRAIKKDDLFVALKGPNFDGADFVSQALKAGAAAALSHKSDPGGQPLILVPDSLKALGDLAKNFRRLLRLKVLAITGSIGKTTVKEMVKNILIAKNRRSIPYRHVLATSGNFNNEVGLPLTLLSALNSPREINEAVLEMGATSPGDIEYLTKIAAPNVGLITAIGPAHLAFFKDVETVAKTKAELFWNLEPGSLAVINQADPLIMAAIEGLTVNRFNYGPNGRIWLEKIESNGLNGQRLTFGGFFGEITVDSPWPGQHNAYNALAATAAALAMGASDEDVKEGLSQASSLAGRLKPLKTPFGFWVIDDSYNANPASVTAGLEFLATLKGPKGAILGDMLELGPDSRAYHRASGHKAAALGLDFLALVGDEAPETLAGALEAKQGQKVFKVFATPEDAARWAKDLVHGQEAYVLVKGSRAGRLDRAVSFLLAAERDAFGEQNAI
ncbi:MAG: UDP-N-acetylmuramoyl-tripeptide--D-alanyl-D-alanine ligase [Deltaproteobacteria bacterium]|jgi:UDP-N-acetylmuramoyl-tripeptide--D-alanyl-D-alanine ligase|nr:UDP-N-acetylmuramoyl-tripeptide--D-alanyl-D-alanine ligase [Deltaproteobacteria bacterium]